MKNMKNIAISIVTGLLIACLPVNAQTLPWQSTSTMQDSHSGFTPSVTNVGAQKANFIPMISTSTMRQVEALATPEWDIDNSNHKGNVRRGFITPGDPGDQSDEFPIGEPWVLLLFAAALAATTAIRRRRRLTVAFGTRQGPQDN